MYEVDKQLTAAAVVADSAVFDETYVLDIAVVVAAVAAVAAEVKHLPLRNEDRQETFRSIFEQLLDV